MLTSLVALLLAFARWAPDSWLGSELTRLTARGVRRLAALRPLTIFCFVVVVAAFAGLIAYGQIEGLIIAGLAAPETFAMFLAIDVGLAVEVLAVAWLAAGRSNLGSAVRQVRIGFRVLARMTGRRSRPHRTPRCRSQAKAANDDEPGAGTFRHCEARAA